MVNILAKLVSALNYILETSIDVAKSVSMNFRKIRKNRKVTLKELSEKSGVSLSSVKRFEYTGEISFVSLIKIASVLNAEAEIKNLFLNIPPSSVEEIIK